MPAADAAPVGYHRAMEAGSISANIAKVSREVSTAADRYGRAPGDIRIVAVSKTRPADEVRAAAACGIVDFGENYLQEAIDKIEACSDLKLCWHFIGPLQSNKTRPVAEHFDWVHSIDREKLLRRLNDQRPEDRGPLNVCIQVNISAEDSKAGVLPSELEPLLAVAAAQPRLALRGLMAIPAPAAEFAAQRAPLDALADLLAQARARYPSLDTLSMGMSADLEAAVAAGSTMLRIGTAIFGPRAPRG
jgi:pyridoxal phosphate enzyme (YggS family)